MTSSEPNSPNEGPHSSATRNMSEFAVTPDAVIVHDPVAAGAFERMLTVTDARLLQEQYLFRAVPSPALFSRQHQAFVEAVERHVGRVYRLSDLVGTQSVFTEARTNPNQVYTRDALVTIPWLPGKYVAGNMHAPIRRPESDAMEAAARGLGLEPVLRLPDDLVLEGGDVIPYYREGRRILLIGYGRRTQLPTLEYLAGAMIPSAVDEIIGVELAPWRINLDGGLVPVAEDVAIAHPDSILSATAFDGRNVERVDLIGMLRDTGMNVITVSLEESLYRQACNCLCLGNRRLVCYDMTETAVNALKQAGVEPIAVDGSELVKGTGGPRCMSRPLYL
ncbi:dimethylarginine dimethylaminohydrolase family protein [Streptomyces sp. NPDC002644]